MCNIVVMRNYAWSVNNWSRLIKYNRWLVVDDRRSMYQDRWLMDYY